jgi:hypothetical protein
MTGPVLYSDSGRQQKCSQSSSSLTIPGITSAQLLPPVETSLTYERPNVYFELGYARGLGKTVITILRSGTNAHFDVRDWTCLEYFDSRPLESDLIERLKFEVKTT